MDDVGSSSDYQNTLLVEGLLATIGHQLGVDASTLLDVEYVQGHGESFPDSHGDDRMNVDQGPLALENPSKETEHGNENPNESARTGKVKKKKKKKKKKKHKKKEEIREKDKDNEIVEIKEKDNEIILIKEKKKKDKKKKGKKNKKEKYKDEKRNRHFRIHKEVWKKSKNSPVKKKTPKRESRLAFKHFVTCPLCSAIFRNEALYKEHTKVHGRGQRLVHAVRTYKPLTLVSRPNQNVIQSAQENYQLSLAKAAKSAEKRSNQSDEAQPKKPKPETLSFKCATCGAVFKTHELCVAHVVERHKSTKTIKHQKREERVVEAKSVKDASAQGSEPNPMEEPQVRSKDNASDLLKSVFKCSLCDTCMLSDEEYSDHVYKIHNLTPSALPGKVMKVKVVKVPKEPIAAVGSTAEPKSFDDGFFCSQCHIKFPSWDILSTHIMVVHGNKDPIPDDCKPRFRRRFSEVELKALNIQQGNLAFQPAAKKRKRDRLTVAETITNLSTVCGVCKSTFETFSSLQAHVIEKHSEKAAEPGKPEKNDTTTIDLSTVCSVCECRFESFSMLKAHVDEIHPAKLAHPWKRVESVASPNSGTVTYCELCGSRFGSYEQFRAHYDTKHPAVVPKFAIHDQPIHHGEKKWEFSECPCCMSFFTSEEAYATHVAEKHPKTPADFRREGASAKPGGSVNRRAVAIPAKTVTTEKTAEKAPELEKAKDGFFCNRCKIKFLTSDMLSTHMTALHSNKVSKKRHVNGRLRLFSKEELKAQNIRIKPFTPKKKTLDASQSIFAFRNRKTTSVKKKSSSLIESEIIYPQRDGFNAPAAGVENTNSIQNQPTVCGMCSVEFNTFEAFQAHCDEKHARHPRHTPEAPEKFFVDSKFNCSICAASYESWDSCMTHCKEVHKIDRPQLVEGV